MVHDGHAPGHAALWLPRQRVLLAGDMLSDIELPLPFWPDDLPAYIAALDALAPYAAKAAVVVPGHGTIGTDAAARLDADRRYIDEVVRTGESDDPRRANPGMDEEYAHLQRLVRGL
ncbi:MBL fold metallo-hydrolase [Microbacterium sp. NIBRBAC000506063]|uniref:MBL fold metallo-hydrolase n=1 Tax=Microbacterium sp. NIBRBAC000506063 TaxID=2734618 RepID=UPI0021D45686|nr:MBL fold metallo-hydrolase [Microbacterium sp. NIBRBAC000506063]